MKSRLKSLAVTMSLTLLSITTMTGMAAQAADIKKPSNYPTRPLTMIVPYGAGGGSDQLARAMANAMDKVAGIKFQVVNKPGGGGTAAIYLLSTRSY